MKPNEALDETLLADIEIYPVGLLADWQHFVHAIDRKAARRALRAALRREWDRIKARKWRAAKSYFNGYLAEHAYAGSRCGTGWTRGRAYRDLARHLNSDPRDNT
ncbi:hypothetical protein ABZ876_08240 [Streptomyces sp. NPDC046931]|uniref:hypothetical protein n=1 Tax=Streptomyces sp. NPDC046931 TaxID=3154806 RepID=UPI0033FBDEDF